MMKKVLVSTIVSILFVNVSYSQCVANLSNVVSFSNGAKNYEIIKENKTWTAARTCAIQRGGRLAVVESQFEQDSLFAFINRSGITSSSTIAPDGGGAAYVWLGGNDRTTEGVWVWDSFGSGTGQFWQGTRTGNAVGGLYNNWGNEPDNFNNQDALGLALTSWPFGVAGEWNDVDESNSLYFVVELPNATGIEEKSIISYQLSPNPVQESLRINCENCIANNYVVQVFDLNAKLIFEKKWKLNETIDVSELSKGTYILKLMGELNTIKFQKF